MKNYAQLNAKTVGFGLDRTEKGITLIALVITIIVLLILAGVSLSLLLSDSGIIGRAAKSKEASRYAELKELWEKNNPGFTYPGYFEYSNNNRFFGMFDVDWDVALSYQFLKCLQITLQTSLKYYPGTLVENKDGEIAERCQFKGVIGLGVGYSF